MTLYTAINVPVLPTPALQWTRIVPGKIQKRIWTARFGKVEDNVVTRFFVRLLVDLLQCVCLVHKVQHHPDDLKYICTAVLLFILNLGSSGAVRSGGDSFVLEKGVSRFKLCFQLPRYASHHKTEHIFENSILLPLK